MSDADAVDADRSAILKTTAELLAAVNASDVDRCVSVWAPDGVLMPPHHPSLHGREAIAGYFHDLFSRSRLRFTFTSSHIELAGDIALERVTYTAVIWTGVEASPIDDVGKGLHVYRRQSDGSWKLTHDIWNSERSGDAVNSTT
jgi:uncharacterized protein (TIGR02246 family)